MVAIDRGVSSNYGAAISIFLNGEECLTYTGRLGGVTFNQITIGRGYTETDDPMPMNGVTYNTATASSANEADRYTGSDDIREAYAKLLPEPTTLALLMLGIGMAALRRKVA